MQLKKTHNNSQESQPKSKPKSLCRDSNMEILRIIAMFLVLIVHSNFYTIGKPNITDIHCTPFTSYTRLFIQSGSTICVNLFVLLSGWYGIKPNIKKFTSLLFQILFFVIISLLLLFLNNNYQFEDIIKTITIYDYWWFVKSYFFLFLFSPILNTFIFNASKNSYLKVLISIFLFQWFFDWIAPSVKWIQGGYSATSFIGLYLLGNFLHTYQGMFINQKKIRLLGIYLLITTFGSSFAFISLYFGIYGSGYMFSYNSPIIISSSVFFFLFFSQIKIKSNRINIIAKSCFAVYLFHTCRYCFPVFKNLLLYIYNHFSYGYYIILSFLTCIFIFIISIIIDRIRLYIWGKVYTIIWK